ncbi:uncharacterized protein NFIA_068890 [Aspergillus fischeri NRRL 181]|uniref:Uncharacterized protein n=1 Tax=Neosartorya fischeri (strain ATCC 1020 / DSM 3700 / CBS 544.65 / FGSC A1164 / JCM 1740 / NRRL 181 / WB 181) TaxID=331117 RepID=A1D7M4_NEOFI|nr:uncharacterized protein NFIA_068890 [Aspergillus fischeri NRRL 181]EAW21718.1 hypothetical protein NFIA_068890 [Aspergillus fischeri NRRL 181]KAG2024786.1 hypothetical protein GB937_003486 [Aspergillus fischeri]
MDLDRKVWIQEGPYSLKHYSQVLSSIKDAKKTEPSHAIVSTPFRLLDLPFEIRSEILCRAISSTDNYWLDREVITFGESLKSIYYIRGRTVWRDSNGVYMNLLTTSKQIYDEVQQVLFSRFAFDALGWGYTMRYSDPSKTPNHLPKHRIMHIAYTPYFTEYMREHRQSVDLILSGLPLLSSVRILIPWACAQRLVICGDTRAGSLHIVAVARLFRQVGKVAIVGQSLMGELQKQLVMEARRELEDEPWYWELDLDYHLFMPFHTSSVEEHL